MIFTLFLRAKRSARYTRREREAAVLVPGKRGPRQNGVLKNRLFQARPQPPEAYAKCNVWPSRPSQESCVDMTHHEAEAQAMVVRSDEHAASGEPPSVRPRC